MKQKFRWIPAAFALLLALCLAGCAPEEDPYQQNDASGFTVSVEYDANGGTFTTNTWIIRDSYNISDLQTDAEGNVQIALLSPDHEARGNDAFTPVKNGCFLAGWYSKRTETLDEAGNPVYVYSGRWDFESDRLEIPAEGEYTSSQPVLTLYAAWIPLFEVEYYDLATGALLHSSSFDPLQGQQITLPKWNRETGRIEMFDLPQIKGQTYEGAFYDSEGTQRVDAEVVNHPGIIDYENGMGKNGKLKLYVSYTEGEWYHIYNTDQFLDNASVSGNYVIHEDLDFTDKIWPTALMYGNFSGTILGNGHTFSNIQLTQTNNSKTNAGLFGHLTDTARLENMAFENVTFTLKAGTRIAGASFGLLAGTISEKAQLTDVTILDSRLLVDSGCYFGTDDYAVGLLCGMGSADVDISGITCGATGDAPEILTVTAEGNTVTVKFAAG